MQTSGVEHVSKTTGRRVGLLLFFFVCTSHTMEPYHRVEEGEPQETSERRVQCVSLAKLLGVCCVAECLTGGFSFGFTSLALSGGAVAKMRIIAGLGADAALHCVGYVMCTCFRGGRDCGEKGCLKNAFCAPCIMSRECCSME